MTLDKLRQPTPPAEIRQRQGPGGKMLDYIDARYVMDTLDDVIGQGNWQDRFEDRADGSVRCGIGIRVGDEWVWKWDVGTPSDIEPEKGSYSEAFKRAAVKWGIGRDLYGHAPTRSSHAPASPGAARPAAAPPSGPPPAGGAVCPLHGVPFAGSPGDYWHKTPEGRYCRPEGQPKKERAPQAVSRPPAAIEEPAEVSDLMDLPF